MKENLKIVNVMVMEYTIYSSNGDKIEGEWKDNCLEGFVIYSTSNGYKYEGVLNKTLKDGYGIINLPNGINIEGLFKNLKI